jgi:hypothetical protein
MLSIINIVSSFSTLYDVHALQIEVEEQLVALVHASAGITIHGLDKEMMKMLVQHTVHWLRLKY